MGHVKGRVEANPVNPIQAEPHLRAVGTGTPVERTPDATTVTEASFFANLASVLRALREFGFFMGCLGLLGEQTPLEDTSLLSHTQASGRKKGREIES